MEEYDFNMLKKQELEALPAEKLRKMDQILKVNKKLNIDTVLKVNRALGMLFTLMEISIR